MAAYRRVYDSRHLQADCQEPGSAPEPYVRLSSMDNLYLFTGNKLASASHCCVRKLQSTLLTLFRRLLDTSRLLQYYWRCCLAGGKAPSACSLHRMSSHASHHRATKVLFYRRVLKSSNVILQTLLSLKQKFVNLLTSSYSIRSLHDSRSAIKQCIWKHNVLSAVNSGHLPPS